MTRDVSTMRLINDVYEGVAIDSSTVPEDITEFEKELTSVIETINNKKLLWINLPIEKSEMIPVLTKLNFSFHRCNEKKLTMVKKLIENSIVPSAPNTMVGVGAVVIRDYNKLLVIKDRIWKKYKLPGGYIDPKENISQAIEREVFEETGIDIELESIVSLCHAPSLEQKDSDLYIVCRAKPLSEKIHINDSVEVLEARWMDLDNYFKCENIHIYNKNLVKAALRHNGLDPDHTRYFGNDSSRNEYYFVN